MTNAETPSGASGAFFGCSGADSVLEGETAD